MAETEGSIRVAWLVGGHPFDAGALGRLIDALAASVDLFEWPEALHLFEPEGVDRLLRDYDVLALYDMPGIAFTRGQSPTFVEPPASVCEGWMKLLDAGFPVLALHHAIASWPTWPEFAEIVKGRFHYVPSRLRGVEFPDSGYAMDVRQHFSVVAPDHPVCAGLPPVFELTDETYLCPVFTDEVRVLITTDAPRGDDHHLSAHAAVRRSIDPTWTHPSASNAVAWTHRHRNSNVVYLQPGEGAEAFDNVWYRRIIDNAVSWLASTRATTAGPL